MKLMHRAQLLSRLAVFVVWGAVVIVGMATASPAQTNTPTLTATNTPTSTPTQTLAPKATEGTSDTAAFQYGSFRMDPTCSALAIEHFTITIPGLKQGDMIVVYANNDFAGLLNWNIIANNRLGVTTSCSTDSASHNWSYIWYARTQNNCNGAPNCRAPATVTPTPTP